MFLMFLPYISYGETQSYPKGGINSLKKKKICSPGENNKVQVRQCNNSCNRERCGRRDLGISKDGPLLTRETTHDIAVTALFVICIIL